MVLLVPGSLERHGHPLVVGEVALDHARLLRELVHTPSFCLHVTEPLTTWPSAPSAGCARAIRCRGRFGRDEPPSKYLSPLVHRRRRLIVAAHDPPVAVGLASQDHNVDVLAPK